MKDATSIKRITVASILGGTLLILALGVAPGPLHANDDHPSEASGYEECSYDLSEYESINLANGNLTFRVPLYTLTTDGGLSYDLALVHNLKRWDHEDWYCGSDDDAYVAEVPSGVESYGFAWDMRPPRISFKYESPVTWVDTSGARHDLSASEPWTEETLPNDSLPPCSLSSADHCYTADGTNLRITVTNRDASGRPSRIEVEAPDGTVYVHDHAVWETVAPDPMQLPESNFRLDVDGLYLSAIERGPWVGGQASNRITFEYCDPLSSDIEESCGGDWSKPWLVRKITASGEHGRFLEVDYQETEICHGITNPVCYPTAVVASISIPAFYPAVGDQSTSATSDITITAQLEYPFYQVVLEDQGSNCGGEFRAPRLSEVRFPNTVDHPTGASFQFPDFNSDHGLVNRVVLPSGANIQYVILPEYPLLSANCKLLPENSANECRSYDACSSGVSRQYAEGVVWRGTTYNDASGVREEGTHFRHFLSCPDSGSGYWPYDFTDLLDEPRYRWTWVETENGNLGGSVEGSTVEIHRFDADTNEEFSIDYLDTRDFVLLWNGGKREEDFDSWDGVERLRHFEIRKRDRFELGDFFDLNDQRHEWSYSALESKAVYTDINPDDGQFCYERYAIPVIGTHPPPEYDCMVVTESIPEFEDNVDPYLNVWARTLTTENAPAGSDVTRSWTYTYHDPTQELDAGLWTGLNLQEIATVCDGVKCSHSATAWESVDNPDGPGRYYRIDYQVTNPEVSGNEFLCHAGIIGGCVKSDYEYDDLDPGPPNDGNRVGESVSGGWADGFDAHNLTTRYAYRHGKPVRKWLEEAGGQSLLLWEREVDPNTGLARWHLDGSGVGAAYRYNKVGRITDIAPIQANFSAGAWSNFRVQAVTGEGALYGSRIEYVFPSNDSLLESRVSDATYSIGSELVRQSTQATRSHFIFDGRGRRTQVVEAYPGADNTTGLRSQFSLDYYDPTLGHVQQSSVWHDGEGWPGSANLNWTTTLSDGLGRPTSVTQPDGSVVTTQYAGDSEVTTTHSVAVDLVGSTDYKPEQMTTTQTLDGLGRLRRLVEQVGSDDLGQPITFETEYGYDQDDRLVQVKVLDGGYPQTRTFHYSHGGFLGWSDEPERSTMYRGYDALGNPTAERSGKSFDDLVDGCYAGPPEGRTCSRSEFLYDGFGRATRKSTVGLWPGPADTSATGYGPDLIGDPAYNKVVSSTQHNYFGTYDVEVSHGWSYDGPGARLSGRATAITGLGETGDAFTVGYGYDRWGNVDDIALPAWQDGCRPDDWTHLEYLYDGAWMLAASRSNPMTAETEPLASYAYHPNGRAASLIYGSGFAEWIETMDGAGMARPKHHDLVIDGEAEWSKGDFEYDESGNIWRIGSKRFTYDGLDRLERFYLQDGATPKGGYEYDRWGNLLSIKRGNATVSLTPNRDTNRIDAINTIDISDAWDIRGNLTSVPEVPGQLRAKSFKFSNEDRLMRATDTASGTETKFAYDAGGERVAKWSRNAAGDLLDASFYVRNEGGQVLSDWTLVDDGTMLGLAKDYYLGASGVIAERGFGTDTLLQYVAADHLGSARVLFDEDGVRQELDYYPYGASLWPSTTPDTTHLFTGHERDLGDFSSELDYMHARYYSPGLGRFLSVDPVGGKVGSSQSWSRFTYVMDNPLSFLDPNGKQEWPAEQFYATEGALGTLMVEAGFASGGILVSGAAGGYLVYTADKAMTAATGDPLAFEKCDALAGMVPQMPALAFAPVKLLGIFALESHMTPSGDPDREYSNWLSTVETSTQAEYRKTYTQHAFASFQVRTSDPGSEVAKEAAKRLAELEKKKKALEKRIKTLERMRKTVEWAKQQRTSTSGSGS